MKLLKDIMTKDVMTVHSQQKLSEVSKLFRDHPIHHVPVLSGQKPVGIISANDLYKLIFDIDHTDQRMLDAMLDHQFTIEQVMSQNLETLPHNANIKKGAKLLSNGSFHSIIVVDAKGDFAGLVTSTDLITYLYEEL